MPRLIDANELKEWVENWFVKNAYYHPYSKSNNIPISELYDILGRMPTVDAERHGRWVYKEHRTTANEAIGFYLCSECGHANWIKEDNYCPLCGAKMDGERREDGNNDRN